MKIPSTFIQELKSALNIVEVAGQYMKVVRKGRNYFALCPFHGEKTPSFSLNEQLQIFHCFGCGKGGDVITLYMELEHLSYPDAVLQLAERAHLKVPRESPDEEKSYNERKFLYTVMEEAARFYRQSLESERGGPGREYLERRRIGGDTIEAFGIGYAPGDGFHLVSYLRGLGMSEKHLLDAGVARRSERTDRLYDYFRDRVIVPIRDHQGRIVAFGGRILGEGEPKYLNSQETPVYRKGDHLFGLNLAGRQIRDRDEAVLVEGYFDLISPWQAGVRNVVASLGTSLTTNQVKLLGRYTRNVKICLDPDTAGVTAAYRSVELFLEGDFECAVVRLPQGKDPDVFVREQGADGFHRLVADALPFLEFVYRRGREGMGAEPTVKQKARLLENLFPFIARVPSPMERSRHVSLLAGRLELDESAVFRQFNLFLRTRKINVESMVRSSAPDLLPAERELLHFLFTCPERAGHVFSGFTVTFDGLTTSNILRRAAELAAADGKLDLAALEASLTEEDRLLVHRVLSKGDTVVLEDEARNCLGALSARLLGKRRQEIQAAIRDAEAAGDRERCRTLIQERRDLEAQIKTHA
ncbi:MAG: DNA primase [Acidobacteria bacterium]|nr:DNA primase [Acidobacteriota bacterium]